MFDMCSRSLNELQHNGLFRIYTTLFKLDTIDSQGNASLVSYQTNPDMSSDLQTTYLKFIVIQT